MAWFGESMGRPVFSAGFVISLLAFRVRRNYTATTTRAFSHLVLSPLFFFISRILFLFVLFCRENSYNS